jgi:Ca2+-binding RTX toxin-like protein
VVSADIDDSTQSVSMGDGADNSLTAFAGLAGGAHILAGAEIYGGIEIPSPFPTIEHSEGVGFNLGFDVPVATIDSDGVNFPDGFGAISVDLNGDDAPVGFDFGGGIGHIDLKLPGDMNGFSRTLTDAGASGLGTLISTVYSDPIVSASIDLDALLTKYVPELIPLFNGDQGYSLINVGYENDFKLVGDLRLKEDFSFTPEVYATMTTSLGQTVTGKAGDTIVFDKPTAEGEGTFTVDAQYRTEGDFQTTVSLAGDLAFAIKLFALKFSVGMHVGPIDFDLFSTEYAPFLERLELLGGAIPLYTYTRHVVLDTVQEHTFDVAYENFRTVEGSGDSFTATTHQISIDGNDRINAFVGNTFDNIIHSFGGDDRIKSLGGNDTIDGGAGNDTINAGADDNTVYGGNGDDRIVAGTGNDTLDGGDDNDTINAGEGSNTVFGGSGDDHIVAGAGDDTLDGGDGNDTIDAGEGNNIIFAGGGANVITAGNGDDTIHCGNAGDTIDAGGGHNTLIGGWGDDIITGGSGTDAIKGGSGFDTLAGGVGDDIVIGGRGNDRVDGGAGNDILMGDAVEDGLIDPIEMGGQQGNTDVFAFAKGSGHDTILDFTEPLRDFDGTLTAVDKIDLTGYINIRSMEDLTFKVVNSDYGLIHRLMLSSDDWIDFAPNQRAEDFISAKTVIFNTDPYTYPDRTVIGTVGSDNLAGRDGNDRIDGGGINDYGLDVLDGRAGNDILVGRAGDDVLIGGAGADKMTGGNDNDVFVFNAVSESRAAHPDIITDFHTVVDRIDLSAIDWAPKIFGDQAFMIDNGDGVLSRGEVMATKSGTTIKISINSDSDRAVDMVILLTHQHAMISPFDVIL